MTHYVVERQAESECLAACGALVEPEDHSDVPDCPQCRAAIVRACRDVAKTLAGVLK